jgi:dTDP-alpha-D-glucose dehydrogenase
VGRKPARLIPVDADIILIGAMISENPRIAVIGLGHVGCPMAAAMADHGCRVVGIDRRAETVRNIAAGRAGLSEPGLDHMLSRVLARGHLRTTGALNEVTDAEAVILTVGTPIGEDGDADLSALEAACQEIGPYLRDGQLIVLKSTVPPGVTEDVVAPILTGFARVDIAFCPERLAEGQALRDLATVPVVVGGLTLDATDRACALFRTALGVKCLPVSSPRASELVKLADNLWIDLNIALANELAKLSDALGLDVLEVISAANSLQKGDGRVNILTPSLGVGGSCLTKDPLFAEKLARDHGIDMLTPAMSRRINDAMPVYSVGRITDALARVRPDAPPDRLKIAVLGIAFKNNTSDCRFSPAKPAIEALMERGYTLAIHDPLVSEADARLVTDQPLEPSMERAIDQADCVAFFAGHADYIWLSPAELGRRTTPGAVVFDGRMFFPRGIIDSFESLGLSYVGVGRS